MPDPIARAHRSSLRDRLHFKAILMGVATAIRVNRWLNPRLRKHLLAGDCVVQIRTLDGEVSRYFEFRRGRFRSSARPHPRPDFEQIWLDAASAAYALPHPDRTELMRANENGIVEFHGEPLALFFFGETMTHVRLDFENRLRRKSYAR
ncbi:hypothetical protein [Oleomonas cavernae]|uniref:hypothetical protein n=1 Tax=Oleomonas cavernae TaxID=2320859 RepID=UPI0011C4ABB3|nr:hypothetical protein [Oleomonas cavernae]